MSIFHPPSLFLQKVPEVVQMLRSHMAVGELSLSQGDLVYIIDKPADGGPWCGVAPNGIVGFFASVFTRSVDPNEVQ